MSTLKKILALSLALAMILSVSVFAGNYSADTYKDAAAIDADAAESVELLYALKVMTGDEKGNFNPNATITRAEVAKMIYVILNYGKDDKAVNYAAANLFTDVPATEWYAGYINYLAALGLVNGSEGKFYPTNPVKTAEAAKMLLTAIGYNSADRQYTGANWAKNVLSDASIVGLLGGYKADINGAAPRQWVAVMFANALLEAYTYKTVVPAGFNGIFTGAQQNQFELFGKKFYGLEVFTGYLFATDSAYIDVLKNGEKTTSGGVQIRTADDDCVIFATVSGAENTTNRTQWIEVDNPGLGYMDLGQKFRVIYKSNGSVYSACLTGDSVVADAEVQDIKVANTQATSKNDANNKYIFTIGDMEAKFNTGSINALKVDDKNNTGYVANYNVNTLRGIAGDLKTDTIRAIDKDGDGDIDYIIEKNFTYARIASVGERKGYGEFFTAKDVNGADYNPIGFTAAANRWYIDDVINCDDELAKNNIIKVVFNPDNGKYDVEILPVAENVKYTKRTTNGIHTLGDEEYQIAANGFEAAATDKVLVRGNLQEEMNIAVDGSLVVVAALVDSNYDNLDDINAQLVMVTDLQIDQYVVGGHRAYIDYMTIDGETHEEVRLSTDSRSGVTVVDTTALTAALNANKRLFVLREDGNQVYLIALTAANAQKILSYSNSLLDGYKEVDAGKLNTVDNEYNDDYVNNENKFFVAYKNSAGSLKFAVMALDDMGEGKDNAALVQGLYTQGRVAKTYQAGYFYLPSLALNKANGYLYSTTGDVWYEGSKAAYLQKVVFSDGTEADEIRVAVDSVVDANCLYSYTYDKVNGEKVYTLTKISEAHGNDADGNRCDFTYKMNGTVTDGADKWEIVDLRNKGGDDMIFAELPSNPSNKESFYVNSKTVIALKTVTLDRDETQWNGTGDVPFFAPDEEIQFVTYADLLANDAVINGESSTDYLFYSDYVVKKSSDKADMLYIISYKVEKRANH